jgi:hypothetical protein
MSKYFFVLVCLNTFLSIGLSAQDVETDSTSTEIWIVKLESGVQLEAEIIAETEEELTLRIEGGEVSIKKSVIKTKKLSNYEGGFSYGNTNETRYFFAPSAMQIEKGSGYYQNVYLTFNFLNYGLSDNISIGGGTSLTSLLTGNPVWFLTPKIGKSINDKFHICGGLLFAGTPVGNASLLYGVATIGDEDLNLSFGFGRGLVNRSFSDNSVFNVSSNMRLSNSIFLLSENYFSRGLSFDAETSFPGYLGIQGIRWQSRTNAFDFGLLFISAISDYVPALPYVSYTRYF